MPVQRSTYYDSTTFNNILKIFFKMKLHFYFKQTHLFILICLGMTVCLSAQFTQQGSKLVGTGNTGAAAQGVSVALSGDGNTALVGGYNDNSGQGAVWVYTRSGSTWTQQGSKLVGTGNTGAARQGISVALSSDGNTALVGGYYDNTQRGAVWVWTRSGSTWTQQGSKLVGTGNTGAANQGRYVALSGDGNTALVGGYNDNSAQGAVWVFTRSGSTWTQEGSKLVGTGNVGAANQGFSVALSSDGNTALVGGLEDNNSQGAVWVWTRSGSTWTQEGSKLVGTGNVGAGRQGASVALSSDGNKALVGWINDNSARGAVMVWTRSGSTWAQEGSKLVGTGNTGASQQGVSVALSSDGNTALVGGYFDNSSQGAVWVYAPAVLPVELLSFTGKPTEGGNLLTWQTANEVNNKGFEIERHIGGSQQPTGDSWETMGFVAAKGKSATYTFTDDYRLSPVAYYRLKQVDNDGKFAYSKVISIVQSSKGKGLTIYPNPVSSHLTIENTDLSSGTHEGGTFQILNLLGQQVLTGKTAQRLDVSALPQGTYVLKVGTEQAKFIKQ